ncbi:MAG: LAGLIDADG family homing endonuclease [bacterium]|nr:LAGLIDADG family homing endonuclease [bacterium]
MGDCIRRYQSLAGLEAQRERASKSTAEVVLSRIQYETNAQQAYAYLLGLYLGDGSIVLNKNQRSYRLRISLDQKYPEIIEACQQTIALILPQNKVSLVLTPEDGYVDVSTNYKHLPTLFPQSGIGPKHLRPINLEAWQQKIVDAHPLDLFRGLYHSDGSRSQNIVNGKNYPRYFFTNTSDDIRRLFCETCDRLGLRWTVANKLNIAISKRKDVEYLDSVIGPKR